MFKTSIPAERRDSTNPIHETEKSISYLGVQVPKAEIRNGFLVPKRSTYKDFINDPDFSLPLQREIAKALVLGEPLLLEGGTSLGKTTTVKKMASELGYEVHYVNLTGTTDVEDLMGRYVVNTYKKNDHDSEFRFADGKVTQGLKVGEGRKSIILLDEINAAPPGILIRLHEILDALERNGEIALTDDLTEQLQANRERTHIIALMNPPGGGFHGRNPMDPAQLRRWTYHKLPSELPADAAKVGLYQLFGLKNDSKRELSEFSFHPNRETPFPEKMLQEIPGIQEILHLYSEFHVAAKKLVSEREIAQDQPQAFTFDERMEYRRVRDYILHFYNGDINSTIQDALRYYYSSKVESLSDRMVLEELIQKVRTVETLGSRKRRSLAEGEKRADMKRATEILGRGNVFGPDQVTRVFPLMLEKDFEIPEIPFSESQLEAANELKMKLILRLKSTDARSYLQTFNDSLSKNPSGIRQFLSDKAKNELAKIKGNLSLSPGWVLSMFNGVDAGNKTMEEYFSQLLPQVRKIYPDMTLEQLVSGETRVLPTVVERLYDMALATGIHSQRLTPDSYVYCYQDNDDIGNHILTGKPTTQCIMKGVGHYTKDGIRIRAASANTSDSGLTAAWSIKG